MLERENEYKHVTFYLKFVTLFFYMDSDMTNLI